MGKKRGKPKKQNKKKYLQWLAAIVIFAICAVIIVLAARELMSNRSEDEPEAGEVIENGTEEPNQMEIVERADASYERWLAAGMVTAISMQYPDFSIEGIYLSGETELSDKSESEGAYVVFTADGAETAIHSVPLDAERTDVGTTDLYTRDLGFATFDTIEPSQIDTGSCEQIEMDDLTDLISQSLLVSLFEH